MSSSMYAWLKSFVHWQIGLRLAPPLAFPQDSSGLSGYAENNHEPTMSKIIWWSCWPLFFVFATVQTSAIAHRRRSRTLTPQAADQVFNSEKEGEHASGEEEPDVDDDKNGKKSNGTNVELEDEEEDGDDEDDIEEEVRSQIHKEKKQVTGSSS